MIYIYPTNDKSNQNQINRIKRSIAPCSIKVIIKKCSKQKSPDSGGFGTEFFMTFKNVLAPILLESFHEMETKGTFPNEFCVASILMITKLYK